jgi:hypothetical protein
MLTALVLSKRRTDWSEERTTQENSATKKYRVVKRVCVILSY